MNLPSVVSLHQCGVATCQNDAAAARERDNRIRFTGARNEAAESGFHGVHKVIAGDGVDEWAGWHQGVYRLNVLNGGGVAVAGQVGGDSG